MSEPLSALPREVIVILGEWLPQVRAVLGDSLVSVYLTGGLVFDEFAPGWSDVDVCVVLEDEVGEVEAALLGALHDDIDERFIHGGEGGWRSGQAVEGACIPRRLAGEPGGAARCFRTFGSVRESLETNPFSPFDRYVLSRHGRRLGGEEIPFAPPSRADLLVQLQRDVARLTDADLAARGSPIWLAGMLQWLARSIVFWRDGRMVSKSAALRREIEGSSPFLDAFRLALTCRREGSRTAAGHLAELRRAVREVSGPAAETLLALAAR